MYKEKRRHRKKLMEERARKEDDFISACETMFLNGTPLTDEDIFRYLESRCYYTKPQYDPNTGRIWVTNRYTAVPSKYPEGDRIKATEDALDNEVSDH